MADDYNCSWGVTGMMCEFGISKDLNGLRISPILVFQWKSLKYLSKLMSKSP